MSIGDYSLRPVFWTNFNIYFISWQQSNLKHLHLTAWICEHLLSQITNHH